MTKANKQTGFTIVELLIVIVVIGILAAITIVAYNGVQQRARDTKRVSDINTLVKSMTMWSIQTGNMPTGTGAGYNDNGTGWVYAGAFEGEHGGYSTNIEAVLVDAGMLTTGVRDPQTPLGNGSYMFYQCDYAANATIYGFFARLESPSTAADNDFSRWSSEGCVGPPLGAQYGMNYAKMFTNE